MRILDTAKTQYIFGVGGEITEVRCVLAKPLTIEEASQLDGKLAQVMVGDEPVKEIAVKGSRGERLGVSPIKKAFDEMVQAQLGLEKDKAIAAAKKLSELIIVEPLYAMSDKERDTEITRASEQYFRRYMQNCEAEYTLTFGTPPSAPPKAEPPEPPAKPIKFREFL